MRLLVVQFALTAVSWPVAATLFAKSTDRAYVFAKVLGPIVVTYIVFTLVTLGLLPLNVTGIGVSLALWAALNAGIQWKKRPVTRITRPQIAQIISIEVVLLLTLLGFVYIKGFEPEIYQIERFMDFGFLQALTNTTTLPLHDIWFAGKALNYYYFGHAVANTIRTLAGLHIESGFFLIQSWIFATLTIATYRLGRDVLQRGELGRIHEKPRKLAGIFAGTLSAFAVVFAGTWYMAPWLVRYVGAVIKKTEAPAFFYPEPTRIIAGTITEMPIYSFLVSDLHGHVWGMLSGVLAIFVILALWHQRSKGLRWNNAPLWALPFVLGIAYMMNSWDAVTLGTLSLLAIVMIFWKTEESWSRIAVACALLPIASYAISLPWSFGFSAPVAGISIVKEGSNIVHWVSFWGGALVFPVVIALLGLCKGGEWKKVVRGPFTVMLLASIVFLVVMELVYISDIKRDTEWFRADTVFKITTQVWLWLGVLTGPAIVWLYEYLQDRRAEIRTIGSILIVASVTVQLTYPLIAIQQAYTQERDRTGIASGLSWWQKRYPNDYAAYEFFRNQREQLPEGDRTRVIIEAEGDSYTDVARFSAILGWPTVVGWPVHEWTWRGCYDDVGKRREEVREVYTGTSQETARAILEKYHVNYIVVGEVEYNTYGTQIQIDKLMSLGEIVFQKSSTVIIEVMSKSPGILNATDYKCPKDK